MRTGSDLREMLKNADRTAEEQIQAILAMKQPDEKTIYPHLKQYVLSKFLLENDRTEDDFFSLAEISLGRSLNIDADVVKKSDLSLHCGGVSSVAEKKVLLFMTLQKALGIKFEPKIVPEITTISKLSEHVSKLLCSDAVLA